MGAVLEHHGDEVGRRLGAVDLRAAGRGKARQQAAVVDVRVGQQDEVEPAEIATERRPIARGRLAAALEHAAVDQEADAVRFHQQAGSGHLSGRTEERQAHVSTPGSAATFPV